MKKRKLLKSALLGPFLAAWVPPVITAITLPAHARTSTSCNDIEGQQGISYDSYCKENYIVIQHDIILKSPSTGGFGGEEYLFTGDVYDVYSNNPIHEVSWKMLLPEQPFRIKFEIKERLPDGCDEDSEELYFLSDLSPGQLFIKTSCGTITIELGGG